MAIDFPNDPDVDDIYEVGTSSWQYDGEKWLSLGVTGPPGPAPLPEDASAIIAFSVFT
jgi:hypothetical protein